MSFYGRWRASERQKLNAELAYLRAQINPHFLFNTLNSLYVLAVKKSDHTAEAIMRLSHMMRYITAQADHDHVPLSQELEYITNYIALQRLRITPNVQIEVEMPSGASTLTISPLVLIPFIENAFKHGVNTEDECRIFIRLKVDGSMVILEVRNKKVVVETLTEAVSGIGLQNVVQRLKLLYGGRHDLIINETAEEFSVHLSLQLI